MAVAFAAWTVVALITSELQYFAQARTGADPEWSRLITGALASCWLWALFTPAIYALGKRYRIDRRSWPRTVPLHLAAAVIATFVDVAILRELLPLLGGEGGAARYPVYVVAARQLFLYSICYFVIVAIAHVRHYATLSYERDVRAAQLEAQLSAARLAALQGQLRPHFLFNTLNMIAEQVYTDPRGADTMLTKLGVLLRSSFVEADREEVPLWRELELLDSYLDIMGARFNGRLRVARDVDPQTLDALVPRFVLQPLVENAIKHGIEPREEGGEVAVAARLFHGALEIVVADDGDGLGDAPIRVGTGVHNTRERLRHLYGEGRQEFSLTPREGGGAVARIVVPYRAGEPAPAPVASSIPAVASSSARHGRAIAREGVA